MRYITERLRGDAGQQLVRARRHLRRLRGDESGNAPLEMAMMVVFFFAFVGLVMVAGRLNVANTEVDAAARTAARTISMARDPHGAVGVAEDEAADAVGAGSSMCEDWTFPEPEIDQGAGTVTVTIRCDVAVDDAFLGLLDMGPTVGVSREVTEVLDQYRSET